MIRVMGLDISTTCVGWCVIDYNENKFNLIDIGYFEPVKKISQTMKLKELSNTEFLDMLQASKNHILDLLIKYKPDNICIEDYIKYMKGGSGANTIIPLACLNKTLCLAAYEFMNFNKNNIHICNVISIRASLRRAYGLMEFPKKEELPPILEKLMNIKLPVVYEQKKATAKKKAIKVSSFTYDQSDSVACTFYYIKELMGKEHGS
jgi:Holliday junction resolvasome RuvABC endonuclease subunit